MMNSPPPPRRQRALLAEYEHSVEPFHSNRVYIEPSEAEVASDRGRRAPLSSAASNFTHTASNVVISREDQGTGTMYM
jgi:hypothetical protein